MMKPKYRFSEFQGDWVQCTAGDILTERKTKQKISDDAPLLAFAAGQGVIDRSEKKTNNRDFLTNDMDNKIYLLTEYNDIVYNPANLKYGAIDRNTLGRGVISPIYVTFTTEEIPKFVEILVKSRKFQQMALKYEEGSVVKLKAVKPDDFVKVEIAIPPTKEEQQKIANFISIVDERISNQENLVEDCTLQLNEFIYLLYSQKLKFKQTDGNYYPDWETVTIGDCLQYEQPSKYIVDSENYDDSYATPVLTANKAFILGYTNETDGIYQKGDVIIYDDFTMDMKYVDFQFKVKSSAIKMLTAKEGNDLLYMYGLLKYLHLSQEEHSRSYISKVEPLTVEVACEEEQKKISEFLSALDKKIKIEQTILEDYKQLRQALVQQLLI